MRFSPFAIGEGRILFTWFQGQFVAKRRYFLQFEAYYGYQNEDLWLPTI